MIAGACGACGLLVACGGGDSRDSWEAVVDTVGDTVVVTTLAGQEWPSTGTLVPEVTIGKLEGEDVYLLGSVRGLAVSPAGDIYMVDTQVPVVRRYGPDGTHLLDIGRKGGGPGEYQNPDGGLAFLPDGRLVVRDPGKAKLLVFSPDGADLAEWTLPSGGGFNTSRKLYTDTLGNLHSMVLMDREASVFDWRFGVARVDPEGVSHDTIAAPEWDYEPPTIRGQREGSTSINNVPFSPDDHWTMSPHGYLVAGLSTEYAITLYKPDGVLRIRRETEPVPVDPEERDDAETRARENMEQQFPGWKWNGPPVPETKPPFRDVFVGDDGRIWVLRSQPGEEIMGALEARAEKERTGNMPRRFTEPVLFDVYQPDGRLLGSVRAPRGFSSSPQPIFRGDTVWAVYRDELDVAYIVRYRVTFEAEP